MELMENPMLVNTDKMSWGTNWSPMINVMAVDSKQPSAYIETIIERNKPLAKIRQRTERNAKMNLPCSSPSRGPRGRMVLIIPNRRILNKIK